MTDPLLARHIIDPRTPKLNPSIANGLATEHMKSTEVEKHVDDLIRSLAKDFPEGMTYARHGLRRCLPHEEFAEQTRKRSQNSANRRTYDVAKSDLYMVRLYLQYKDMDLDPVYLYLPYMTEDNGPTIMISESRFVVSPVLADRVFSVGINDIFMLLTRARLTFNRLGHHFKINGQRETVQVVWSQVHNVSAAMKKMRKAVKAETTLMHYLLCKYGFTGAFARFADCHPVVGDAEINEQTYPPDQWVICSSNGLQPAGCKKTFWLAPTLRVAIRRSEMNDKVKSMLAGFFYIVDHFPLRMTSKDVDVVRFWKIIMGNILFSSDIHHGRLHDDIDNHLQSLDEYIDSILQVKLRNIGISVDNIYELFAIIVEKYNAWLLGAADKVASMYGKEISILYYTLYNISSAIVNMYFRLKAASKKDSSAIVKKEMTAQEINKIIKETIKPGLIFFLTKQHGEVSTISAPGDNKAFKLTTILVQQTDTDRSNKKGDRVSADDPVNWAHSSIMEVGGYAYLPKSDPTGRGRINQHLLLDEKHVVQRRPEFVELLDDLQEKIRR